MSGTAPPPPKPLPLLSALHLSEHAGPAWKEAFGIEAAAGEELRFLATYMPPGGQLRERSVVACPKCKDNEKEMHRLGVRAVHAARGLLILLWTCPVDLNVLRGLVHGCLGVQPPCLPC